MQGGLNDYPVSMDKINYLVDDIDDGNISSEVESKEVGWKRLTNILLSSNSEPGVLGATAHLMSTYFPSVSKDLQEFFIQRLLTASNEELSNIIIAIYHALSIEQDDDAEIILDLLRYLPDPVARLKSAFGNH